MWPSATSACQPVTGPVFVDGAEPGDALLQARRFGYLTVDAYGDGIACTSVENRKSWYDGGGGPQIWPLLERQKSQ